MSSTLAAINKKPSGYWPMGSTPLVDASGHGNTATAPGQGSGISLADGCKYSSIIDKNATVTYPSPLFSRGLEQNPFSLRAVAKPVFRTSDQTSTFRENLCRNPSFQTNTTTWTIATGATIARSTAQFFNGTASLAVTTSGSAQSGATYGTGTGSYIPVVAGDVLTASGYVLFTVTNPNINVFFRWYDASAVQVPPDSIVANPTTLNTWTRVSNTATAPAGAVWAQVMFRVAVAHTAQTFYLDSVLVEKSSTVNPFFDGSILGYQWEGTADASASKTVDAIASVNLVKNPMLTTNTTNWGGANGTLSRITTDSYEGTSCLQISSTAAGAFYTFPSLGAGINAMPVIPGQNYYYKMAAKSGTYTGNLTLTVYWYKSDGTLVTNTVLRTYTPLTSWTYIELTVTPPANAVFGTFVLQGIATGAGQTFMSDYAYFGTKDTQPFDGDSLGAAWSGTAYNSLSYTLISKASQQVIGSNTGDGLLLNGTVASFCVNYLTAPQARVDYDFQVDRRVDLVGVYTNEKILLYVDAELVAESSLTATQKTDSFSGTGPSLFSGATTASQALLLNGVGVFDRAIDSSEIEYMYEYAYRPDRTDTAYFQFKGKPFTAAQESLTIFESQDYSVTADWQLGTVNNVTISDNGIIPTVTSDISNAGSWTTMFPIYLSTDSAIFGVNVDWNGLGIVVEASLDQVTWETCYRGKNIALTQGIDPTSKVLFVRISFAGNILNDTSYLKSLSIVGFEIASSNTTTSAKHLNARETVWTAPVDIRKEYAPSLLSSDWGTKIKGGTYTIKDNAPAGDFAVRTVEVWIRADTRASIMISSNVSSGTTLYQNSKSFPSLTVNVGDWNVLHYVSATDIVGDISISGYAHVGRVVLYPTTFSLSQVQSIYNSFTGTNNLTVNENTSFVISQPVTDPLLYAHDWSIIASG